MDNSVENGMVRCNTDFEERRVVFECDICGDDIYEGDDYCKSVLGYCCMDCVEIRTAETEDR